jgi:Flp pilus assembly protein TadD
MDIVRTTGLGAGLTAGALFMVTAGPSLSWQDSGELVSAAFQLGVPHPTGFPPVMMGAKLLTQIPLGEVALRAAWLSSITAALAVGLLAALCVTLWRRVGSPTWMAALAGALTALGLACSPTLIQNTGTLEAYGPSLALLVAMISLAAACAERPSGRLLGLIALCYGLGDTTHVIVRFHGLLPLVAALWWCRGLPRRRSAALVVAAIALGALATIYVPLASLRDAPIDWGDPETPARLWDHLSGGRIRRAFVGRMLNPAWVPLDAPALGRMILGDLGLPLLLLAAVGLFGTIRSNRRVGWLVVAVAVVDAAYCVLLNPMGIVDRQVGFPLLAMISLLAGGGLITLARVRRDRGWRAFAAVVAVVAVSHPLLEAARWRGPGHGPASMVARALDVPARSALLCSSDNLCGGLLWAQYVEGDRPDVVALPRQHLWDEATLRSRLSRHAPDLLDHVAGGLSLIEAVDLLEVGRPVYWKRGGDESDLRHGRPRARLTLDAPVPLLRADGGGDDDVSRTEDQARVELEAEILRWYGQLEPPDPSGRAFFAGALSSLAIAAGERGETQSAVVLFERSFQLAPRASPLLNLSALEVRAGRRDEAWRWIELALETEPGSVRALTAAGKLQLSRGHDERSRPYFEQARRLCPTRCGAPLEGLGILAARAGDYAEARALLTEALRLEPWLEDARTNLELLPERVRE